MKEVANIATQKAKKVPAKKTCTSCGRSLNLSDGFYSSKSPLFALDGKVNICKDCFIKNSLNEDGEIDETKLQQSLRQIDKPYYRDNILSATRQFLSEHSYLTEQDAKAHGAEIVRLYMKNINSLRQLASKNYTDSEKDGFIQPRSTVIKKSEVNNVKSNKGSKIVTQAEDDEFEVTGEMIDLFGDGFTPVEYKKMYDKYQKLRLNYTLQTNLHQEALATYVRFKVKEEIATAAGDVDEAKKWYDAAQNAADKGKLTPKQLTQADLQGGINSFSELFKAVEQAVDVIPILPQFKYRPNDACDFIIWCYINYERDLHGQPLCQYEDIYKFYDKRKEEYISQYGDPYGIFDDDPTETLRPNIKKFITLPSDYGDGDNT